jgi:hypothetical protein
VSVRPRRVVMQQDPMNFQLVLPEIALTMVIAASLMKNNGCDGS